MEVEQFVMAYGIEQDRIRAMLPTGFESLRPVLRINTEIRDGRTVYLEFNTPVAAEGKRGWLNIANWSSKDTDLAFQKSGKTVTIDASFFHLVYTGTGLEGGCPAEKDNDGCFFIGEAPSFRERETIKSSREFCDCEFSWKFHPDDAYGKSIGKTLPAYCEYKRRQYPPAAFTAENAAGIPCTQVLGSYIVRFERR